MRKQYWRTAPLNYRYKNLTVIILFHHIDITVMFNQSTYSVNENAGPAQPTLILSNPSSTDITVRVRDTQGSASK